MPAINGYIVRMTSEPELKSTPSGKAVCSFNVANEEGYGDKKETQFIPCVAWNKVAETICTHIRKGTAFAIQGKWTPNNYEKNGVKHYSWQYVVYNTFFLPRNKDESSTIGVSYEANSAGLDYNSSQDDFSPINDDSEDLPF